MREPARHWHRQLARIAALRPDAKPADLAALFGVRPATVAAALRKPEVQAAIRRYQDEYVQRETVAAYRRATLHASEGLELVAAQLRRDVEDGHVEHWRDRLTVFETLGRFLLGVEHHAISRAKVSAEAQASAEELELMRRVLERAEGAPAPGAARGPRPPVGGAAGRAGGGRRKAREVPEATDASAPPVLDMRAEEPRPGNQGANTLQEPRGASAANAPPSRLPPHPPDPESPSTGLHGASGGAPEAQALPGTEGRTDDGP